MNEETQNMALVHADEVPINGTSCDDINKERFGSFLNKQYGELLNDIDIPYSQLLVNLGLAKDNMLNLAGLMLFGSNPQRHRPAFVVKAVSFLGNEDTGNKYRDSEDIEGCLRDMYKGTISFLTRNLRHIQNGKSFNSLGDLEIPLEALEELVANMLLHRDYFISAPCRVFIFDNRVEIVSPGALPNNITIENIRNGVSIIRNPIIISFATKGAGIPYRGIGTGIRRSLAAVPALGLESDNERNLFIARIPRVQ